MTRYSTLYHCAMSLLIVQNRPTPRTRLVLANALRELRRTHGRPAARREYDHMRHVNPILFGPRVDALGAPL